MKKICIAASCYNESANIMTLYNEILKQIEKNNNLQLKGKNRKNIYKYGDKISLLGNFEFGEISRNPGNFDYREYLKTKGIIRNCKS